MTLQPHGFQHTSFPCPSLSPVYSNSCPLSQWHHPIIVSSVTPFSSWPQSFPAWGSFLMSQLFPSGCSSIDASAISPSNEYSGLIFFRIDWFDLLAVQGTLKSLLQHHKSKASILWGSAFFTVQLSHLVVGVGAPLRCSARASHSSDFSCCRAQALGAWNPAAGAHSF